MNNLLSGGKNKKKKCKIDENFEKKVIKIINKPDVNILDDEKVMVDFNTGKYFVVKGVGNDIWDMIQDGVTVGKIIDNLLENYEVERDECLAQTTDFISKLMEYGFVDVE